jgi:DNA-directed RNA polymerase specialized sigma54-like protein
MDSKELRGLMEAYSEVYATQEELDEAEGSYGETPKAYSAASKTKMTAKRKPFLKAMQRRTNPANRKDAYDSSRKGMTADDREEARAGAAHGSPRGHDYPSQGPGGVTKNPKKLRKQKAMGEFAKEELDIFDVVLEFLQVEGYAETLEEAEWMMANELDAEDIEAILEAEQLNELSNRKLRAYIKKSQKSHDTINKKWDQGTATEKEKLKSIGHEIGQERAYKKMDKRAGR